MTVHRKDFGEKVSGMYVAGKEDKTEELLRDTLLKPVETHGDGLGLLRPNRRSGKSNRTLVVDKQEGGDCWGWSRLVRMSVSSTTA